MNLLGKSWGLHFNYFNLSNRFKTNIEIGEEGQDDYHTEEILSKDPAKSANFVCWHKDPTNLRDKGLRNVTINLTALPVITAVNYFKVKDFKYDDEGVFEDEVVSRTASYELTGEEKAKLEQKKYVLSFFVKEKDGTYYDAEIYINIIK